MPTEKDLVRRLVQELQDYEVEMKALGLVLAAMRRDHPAFPALELLEEARLYPQFREDVQMRYKTLLQEMESVELSDLLDKLPPSKYLN
jgi:hypothetical protein